MLVSSNNKELLDYKIQNFEFNFIKSTVKETAGSEKTEPNFVENSSANIEIPENLDEISFEFIDETLIPKGYSLNIKKRNVTKDGVPPTQYYYGYKTKSNWLRLLYFPIDTDEDGIIYKFGHTMGFFKKWYWDDQWKWIQGHTWWEQIYRHPLCGESTYKLGISAYSNNPDNIDIQENW